MRNVIRSRLEILRITVLVVILSMIGGCANLGEVRAFATEAAGLPGEFGILSREFRETWVRQEPYLVDAARDKAEENHRKRQALERVMNLPQAEWS